MSTDTTSTPTISCNSSGYIDQLIINLQAELARAAGAAQSINGLRAFLKIQRELTDAQAYAAQLQS